jgi:hypothetical protein
VIQSPFAKLKKANERNLAEAIDSFAADHKVRQSLLLQRFSLFPHRAPPPKGSLKASGESPLEKSIAFLLEFAMYLG